MTTRLFVCIAVSTCIHALVIIQPWHILGASGMVESPDVAVPVRLVEEKQPEESLRDVAQELDTEEEGISFEVEGVVSADYLDQLKVKIFDAWEYPADAIEKAYEGTVKISFVLDASGRLVEIGVLSSSGHYSLDTAAMAAIELANPFGPFTEDIAGQSLKITGNFCYLLD